MENRPLAEEDVEYITRDLKDTNMPWAIIYEFEKDHLTWIPFIGPYFEFLPTNDEGTVRVCATLGYLEDPLTIAELIQAYKISPGSVLSHLVYTFPCIIDGDGKTSFSTDKRIRIIRFPCYYRLITV